LGLPKDFHLAKRYYDMALEYDKNAVAPVFLMNLKLRWSIYFNSLSLPGIPPLDFMLFENFILFNAGFALVCVLVYRYQNFMLINRGGGA